MVTGDVLLAVFFGLMLVNMAYLWYRPFGERRPDPFFIYLVIFGAIAVSTVAMLPAVPFLRDTIPWTFPRFMLIAFVLCLIEELLCYTQRVGIFADGQYTFGQGLLLGTTALVLWSAGAYFVAGLFVLEPWQLYLVWGISGWVNEMILVPRFFAKPFISVFLFPSVLIPYLVLVYLPFQTVATDLAQSVAAWWMYPLAVLIPSVGFMVGGGFGFLCSKQLGKAKATEHTG